MPPTLASASISLYSRQLYSTLPSGGGGATRRDGHVIPRAPSSLPRSRFLGSSAPFPRPLDINPRDGLQRDDDDAPEHRRPRADPRHSLHGLPRRGQDVAHPRPAAAAARGLLRRAAQERVWRRRGRQPARAPEQPRGRQRDPQWLHVGRAMCVFPQRAHADARTGAACSWAR
jgi:hypothetical protein